MFIKYRAFVNISTVEDGKYLNFIGFIRNISMYKIKWNKCLHLNDLFDTFAKIHYSAYNWFILTQCSGLKENFSISLNHLIYSIVHTKYMQICSLNYILIYPWKYILHKCICRSCCNGFLLTIVRTMMLLRLFPVTKHDLRE